MGLALNLLGFVIGETVKFTVLAKERDGTVLSSAATATMTMFISADAATAAFYTFNASTEVVLTDAPTSNFTITLPEATIPLVLEGVIYRYDIYTVAAGGDRLHQVGGSLQLQAAAEA